MKLKQLLLELDESNLPDTLLVIDVESTCWRNKEEQGNQKNEIIEIGLCPINNGKVGKKNSILIKPQFSKISPFCEKLTNLTNKEVQSKGLMPKQAYSKLNSFYNSSTWASWGNYDLSQLKRMFSLYGISNTLPKNHINIRHLFSLKVLKKDDAHAAKNNPADAMKGIGMSFVGVNHRGDDDAFNIAKIYDKLKTF